VPGLHEALVGLGEGDFVIVDGTLIPTDRVTVVLPRDTGPHARPHRPPEGGTPSPRARNRPGLPGCRRTFRTPYYHHSEQPERYRQFNRDHARLRALGERAFAQLKSWRPLRRARCSTRPIGTITYSG